jgi:AmmeMemoRadiSam system protein B
VERAFYQLEEPKPLALGHVYGGVVSHHIPTTIPRLVEFYSRLKAAQKIRRIIVIGPDHTDAGQAPITVSAISFFTVFGELAPLPTLAQQLQEARLAYIEEAPFDPEHSIGSQMLVISKILPGVEVLPIIVRSDTSLSQAQQLGRSLAQLLDEQTVLIASVDFSHYLTTDQALPIDQISASVVRDLDLDSLSLITADSNKAMAVFMEAMKQKEAVNTDAFAVLNTNDFMQNSDYTTGYVFGYWGR